MRNTLGDLNNYLFEQIERLNDDELEGDSLQGEITRAKAVCTVATQIVNNGKLILDARKFNDNRMDIDKETPKMLEG
ncbi:hypothetical protein JR334_01915 [Clostridia bacterium]|nr:hypothetical protein JR334_01915 [Clostridia bacterium]